MRIAIIGAGLAGLTAAYEIHKEDPAAEIEIFEAADRIGGKLYTVPFQSGRVDVGAEAFLARRTDAVEFFKELGLGDHIVGPSGLGSLIYSGGTTHAIPRTGVMGIPSSSDSLRALISAETAERIDAEADAESIDWQVGQDASVGKLVAERFGQEVSDRVVSALLGGVYSCAADDLGIRATVPQLASALDELAEQRAADLAAGAAEPAKVTLSGAVRRVEEQRAAAMKQAAPEPGAKPRPVFGAFRGGYAELYETLAEKSRATIHIDSFISGVKHAGPNHTGSGGFELTGSGDKGEAPFDRVLFATPAPTTARLLPQVAPDAAAELKQVKLASSVVVALRFESDTDPAGNTLPDNSGVLVALDEPGVTAKAFTFASNKWPHLAEQGLIVRASFGRFGDDAIVRAEEDDLVDYALDDLKTITGFDGREAGVAEIYTQRWFGGIPRFDATHLATVDRVRTLLADVPGIDVTGAWAGGVGVPAVIADAREAARRILA